MAETIYVWHDGQDPGSIRRLKRKLEACNGPELRVASLDPPAKSLSELDPASPGDSRDRSGTVAQSAVPRLISENASLRRRLDAQEYWFHATVHELRTAMGCVVMYAAMIENGQEALDSQDIWVGFRAGMAALQRGIQDLEVFSQSEVAQLRLEPEVQDLAALVADFVEQHRAVCHECELQARLNSTTVALDGTRLTQVLANLVDNAHKFTLSAGRRPEVKIRVGGDGEWAVLEVLDNGPGVRADQKEQIFAPFARSDGADTNLTPGMGLGLSVVRRIVRAHGGEVDCADNPGGPGSCFVVRLPVVEGGNAPSARRGEESTDRESRALRPPAAGSS